MEKYIGSVFLSSNEMRRLDPSCIGLKLVKKRNFIMGKNLMQRLK